MYHSENQGSDYDPDRIIIPEEEIIKIVAEQLGRSTMHFNYWSNLREWHATSQDVYQILEKLENKHHILWDETEKDRLANQDNLCICDIHLAVQHTYRSYR